MIPVVALHTHLPISIIFTQTYFKNVLFKATIKSILKCHIKKYLKITSGVNVMSKQT